MDTTGPKNDDNSDECLENCQRARCGDGQVRTGVEACDDGNTDQRDACTGACTLAICGDGIATHRTCAQGV